MKNNVHVVIPARYGSTRLPGKPLADINGKPMIQHVYERAKEYFESVVVATDDERVVSAVSSFGGEVVMTDVNHRTGSDRLAEVARKCWWPKDDVVINWQGDEPALPGRYVEAVRYALDNTPHIDIATAVVRLTDWLEYHDPNVVKVVVNDRFEALYFSRSGIPFPAAQEQVPTAAYRHVGIYAYRVSALMAMAEKETTVNSLDYWESLEQLRALSMGMKIGCAVLPTMTPHGVDTPSDLEKMRELLSGDQRG